MIWHVYILVQKKYFCQIQILKFVVYIELFVNDLLNENILTKENSLWIIRNVRLCENVIYVKCFSRLHAVYLYDKEL